MLYINAKPGDKLNLGRKGENLARTILFDISQWRKLYGDGVVALLHQRAGDAVPYPCNIETDGNTVAWAITAADTAVASQYGKYELQYRVNDQLAKSATGAASVYESLGESTAEPPEAQQGWVDKVLQAGAEAEAAAKRAEAAAEKAEGSDGGGGGTTDHDKLRNREAADQHPMSAITGLEKALEEKQSKGNYLTTESLGGAVNDALAQAKESGQFDGDDYILTDADKREIAEQAAELVEIPGGGAVTAAIEPAEDDIPKVFFGGALQQTKDEAVVSFRYISKTQDISGYAEIKAQGNSSMSYPKKNQTVKLFKDAECTEKLKVDFKGWGKQNKHVYKANWIDITHARNVVSARLWADVVKSRANYAELPELLRTSPNQGAVDGFPVKVYADGVYQGRYTLNIPKDAWMANLDDDLDNHCILCGENYVSGCFRAAANINGSDWTDEVHDTVPASIKTRWNEVISFVMNSGDEEFRANLNQYFYVDSLIDYYLFGLASCGLDAFGKNQLYMTYDGRKWFATMYDMDSTWGLWWNGSSFVATDYDRSEYQDFKDGEGNLLYIRLEALFHEELQARWAELRSDALSIENIINRFERFTDIAPAELVKEDYASTTADGKFTGIPSKTTSTIQQIRAYALARHAWCDTYISALSDDGEVEPDVPDVPQNVPCTGITLSATSLTFTGAGTQTLVATVEPENTTDSVVWSVDNRGIATVSNGVVTAVANGSCTIAATCGEYSASCSVSVSGISDEIDYSLNPLDGMSWAQGYQYDSFGNLVAANADVYATESTFKLQACVYRMSAVNSTYPTLHMWDENDEYVGYVDKAAFPYDFAANANFKYAINFAATNVPDFDFDAAQFSMMPLDNSATAPETSVVLDAAELTWMSGARGSESIITEQMNAGGIVITSSVNSFSQINRCSHVLLLWFGSHNQVHPQKPGKIIGLNFYQNNVYLQSVGVDPGDAPTAIGTITIN